MTTTILTTSVGPQSIGSTTDDLLILTRTGLIQTNTATPGLTLGAHGADATILGEIVADTGILVAGDSHSIIVGSGGSITSASGAISSNFANVLSTSITNAGHISAITGSAISLSGGSVSVRNTGVLESATGGAITLSGLFLGLAAATIFNSGTVIGSIHDANTAMTLSNSGVIYGSIFGAGNSDPLIAAGLTDVVINSGTIFGSISLASGADRYDGASGQVLSGSIDLGDGNDTCIGGVSAETVIGGTGNDIADLGAGNDIFTAGGLVLPDGNDILDGGLGIDTYNASAITTAITVDLINELATGADIGFDDLNSFENVIGGSGADSILGSAANNALTGGGGNDTLNGGVGKDVLTGGAGLDSLIGGVGRDTFVFLSATDTGSTAPTADIIKDFQHLIDKIDLTGVDANVGSAGDQAFTFIGTSAFHNLAGELRLQTLGTTQYLVGDTNGDSAADLMIAVKGTVTAADILR